MVRIYGIKNCDTMKKAFAWCDGHGLTYTFHDDKNRPVLETDSGQLLVGFDAAMYQSFVK